MEETTKSVSEIAREAMNSEAAKSQAARDAASAEFNEKRRIEVERKQKVNEAFLKQHQNEVTDALMKEKLRAKEKASRDQALREQIERDREERNSKIFG
jgi:hypothetical protein